MRRWLLWAAMILRLHGCVIRDWNGDSHVVVACIGDSNTKSWREGVASWCDLMALAHPEITWVNPSFGGAAAVSSKSLFKGRTVLDSALASTPAPDVAVIALGSNDMNQPAATVVAALLELASRAEAAGAVVVLATVPHMVDSGIEYNEHIDAINALLRDTRYPLVDFTTGHEAMDYADFVHFNARGQAKRAKAANDGLWGRQ